MTIATNGRRHQEALGADVFSWSELPDLLTVEDLFDTVSCTGSDLVPSVSAGRDDDEDDDDEADEGHPVGPEAPPDDLVRRAADDRARAAELSVLLLLRRADGVSDLDHAFPQRPGGPDGATIAAGSSPGQGRTPPGSGEEGEIGRAHV